MRGTLAMGVRISLLLYSCSKTALARLSRRGNGGLVIFLVTKDSCWLHTKSETSFKHS